MSGYERFAVAGAGNLGRFIIQELVKLRDAEQASVVNVLTRHADGKVEDADSVQVDYTVPDTLVAALANTDVVISTLGRPAFDLQETLARAAKTAGVKLFVPSEFGNPTEGREDSWFAQKNAQRLKLKEIGMPYALFYNGPFPDFVINPHMGFDLANGKAVISGEGTSPISFTSRRDVARFLAHVLTTLPPGELDWRAFRIEGDHQSMNGLMAEYKKKSGKPLEITHRSRADLEQAVKDSPLDVPSTLLLSWDKGEGVVGTPDQLSNPVWPEWNPKKAVDVLLEGDQ